ncbi:hypothetical protein PIB30_017234 [Stylosanthes scabra]|uniref:AAA+ ATPase domain-containing protein n=1 Tax=Stylosanthes scabra TaxID=79078 RepID=A0ABU6Z9A9_9FABA|nr:hypothetical protein [Stylosanthes scabra]
MDLLSLTTPLQDLLLKRAKETLKQEVDYLWNYKKNIEDLQKQVNKLKKERQKLGDRVAEDEDRHGREIYDDVSKWLTDADDISDKEYLKFKKDEEKAHSGCSLAGFPPNLLALYLLSKESVKLKGKAESHLQKANFDIISRSVGPPSVGLALSNVDYEDLPSRATAMEDILNALNDSSARMIGVHGPSGVGKTTLVMEAVNRVQNDQYKPKLFDVVIMANVTKSPNIRKIQGQIADMLWMKLEEESEEGRASRIRERLKKEKESTLIILDDLSATVDLKILGIPWQSGYDNQKKNPKEGKSLDLTMAPKEKERQSKVLAIGGMKDKKSPADAISSAGSPSPSETMPTTEERYKGCKVLLISELRQVLNQMEVRPDVVVPVNLLNEKDASSLFNKMAGIDDKSPELGELPAQIINKCDGLPMSIVTTAKALKNRSRLVWEGTRQKLESQTVAGTPEHSTRVIYDLLENEELKTTFLLCACMDNDALISELVRLCIGLGFLQGIYTIKDARSRVHLMVMKLRELGLLCNSYSSDRFTMQNLVRNAALSIALKEKHMLILSKGRIDEWPDDDELTRYVAISLRRCDVSEAITKSIKCDRLKIFQLDNNDPHLELPKEFFKQMKELKVLILTGVRLSLADTSIDSLTKLRMLCLEHCTLIPSSEELRVKNLKNLRILSFSGSNIDCLPIELGSLSKLQTLDISNCPNLSVIPPNVISRLTSLEELYMRNTPIQWPKVNNRGESHQSKNASLLELGGLNQLTNLDIQIESVDHLPENLFFDKLSSYKIVIGSWNRYSEREFKMPEKHELSRFLAINQKGGINIHSQKGIKMLFERVEYLLLGKLTGVEDLFYELNLKGFPHLKYLAIQNNHDIQFLIHPKDRQQHQEKAFERLETLELYKVTQIEEIICSSSSCLLSESSFVNLKTIKINFCEKLKYLFSTSMLELLTALETIQAFDCDSLKEIVPVESTDDESKTHKLPKLHTLTLQYLPEFCGFDPTSTTQGSKTLFQKKVEVLELERMELRSIRIEHIWIDQSSGFGNLIHLDVSGCDNLKYLFPFSLVTNLKKLQSLYVRECYQMENIFPDGPVKVAKDVCFPNLKNIKLSRMSRLRKIWNLNVPAGLFGKVDTLVIEKCNQLVSVFHHDMEGIFQGLSSLTVTNCDSMENIFDLTAGKNRYASETILRDIHLESLPKLQSILRGTTTLQLKSLQNITVHYCGNLENIFPFPIVAERQLVKLQCLVVSDCSELKEIVAAQRDNTSVNSSSSNPAVRLEFPELTTIKFSKLPKFQNFCPGDYCEFKSPKLDNVSIELCGKLELYREEASQQATTSAQQKPLFHEKVMNKLRSMHIELQHTNLSTRYRRDKLEVLRLSKLENTDILYRFLNRNPNLKSLWLEDCSFSRLVEPKSSSFSVGIEKIGVVPKLKTLKLTNLPSIDDIGFEEDAILQRIESLILENCPSLVSLVPSKESACFAFLTNLEVVDCSSMRYLMPPSTAKSLVQLVTMKVINCESMEEIVSDHHQGGEEEVGGNIVFKQMKYLELVCLNNLISFCSSSSCSFEFPSLEKFVVSACPKMEKFSEKDIKTTPTIMQKVYVARDEEKRLCWNGDIPATIRHIYNKKKYFEGMDTISVSEHPVLEEGWKSEKALERGWFYSLKTLTLESCKFESCAIPSFVLRCLKGLKELNVQNCKSITSIFEMNDIKGTFQLEMLTLEELPNVTHVWSKQDKQNDSRFRNLQKVIVDSCGKLKALFPLAIAANLKMLECLEVNCCGELLEIVEKDESGGGGTESFVFPYLRQLGLYRLPQLTYFCDGMLTLECPELKIFYPLECSKIELLNTPTLIKPALFSNIKDISKVETLSMRSKEISVLRLQQFEDVELKYLGELILSFDDDVNNEYSTLPSEILGQTPKLKTMMVVNSSSLEEIMFPSQNLSLETLSVQALFKLSSIGGLQYLTNLQDLYFCYCPLLRKIENYPPIMRKLFVRGCHGLQCLFTSSAARTLKHLEELSVYDCISLTDIVEKDQDVETAAEDIIFEWLKTITLHDLESLKCFYTGNAAALKLPSLVQVKIWKCAKMTIFSHLLRDEDPSRKISLLMDNQERYIHTMRLPTLNIVLQWQFFYQVDLVLKDYPEMQGEWVSKSGILNNQTFKCLLTLEVEDCDFLTNAVLSSDLLPLLSTLKELTVKRCKHVEAIFDVKNTPSEDDDPNKIVTIPLRKIILEDLPTLAHVWNSDPKASSLSFTSLEIFSICRCNSIKSLFPASVPRENLQELDVKNCGELEEIIVAQDENNKEGIILFPELTYLALLDLPKLRYICSGMRNLEDWLPFCSRLYVQHCPLLKVFAADIQNSNPGGEPCSSAQEVITFNFEEVQLSKEDVTMIEKGLLRVNFPNLNYLGLNNFNDNEFPDFFFSKISLPKLQAFQLVDCAFEDIFRPKEPDIDYSKFLMQIRYLDITNLYKCNSMGFEHPWMSPLLQTLETLRISECNYLTNLIPSSSVSFFCLGALTINCCAGLKYLFTTSTAKSLGLLQELTINKCKSLETVVAHEETDNAEDMVLFSKLWTLSLSELPQLESFYTGSSTLYFREMHSSRVSFTITKCNKMKTFSHGDVLPRFVQGKIDEHCGYGDVNTLVQKQFQKTASAQLELLRIERSLMLLSFIILAQNANHRLMKKQRRKLELPCPPEYNENISG